MQLTLSLLTRAAALLGIALIQSTAVHAQRIEFDARPLAGNVWQLDYTLINTSPSLIFDEVTVYFEFGRFELISAVANPVGWDPLVIQPELSIPADGFYDVLSLTGPVAFGSTTTGFSITVSFLDAGAPGSQRFELVNSTDFSVVQSGFTVQATAVPEPASLGLAVVGLTIIGAALRGANKTTNVPSRRWPYGRRRPASAA